MPSPPEGLTKIAAASPRDVVALSRGNRFYHWNGSDWRLAPDEAFRGEQIDAIAAVPGTGRYWAVGQGNGSQTLALRWNGKRWSRVRSPRPGFESGFTNVVPLGPRNVWAIGWYRAGWKPGGDAINYAVSAHWNGRRWKLVAVPRVGRTIFDGADAASPRTVWAVGWRVANGKQTTLAARWNGSQWELGAFFRLGREENALLDVSAASRRAAWAVGYTSDSDAALRDPLILRWNGRQWRRSAAPSFGERSSALLTGVEAVSAREAWAIGENGPDMFLLRWNGRAWRVADGPPVPPPAAGAVDVFTYLFDVTRVPGTRTIWVVGTIAHIFARPGNDYYDTTAEPLVARLC